MHKLCSLLLFAGVALAACGGNGTAEPGCIDVAEAEPQSRGVGDPACTTSEQCNQLCLCNDGTGIKQGYACVGGVCDGKYAQCESFCGAGGVEGFGEEPSSGASSGGGSGTTGSSSGASPCTSPGSGRSGPSSSASSSGGGSSTSSSSSSGSGGSSGASGDGVRCSQSEPENCSCAPLDGGVDVPNEISSCGPASTSRPSSCCATEGFPTSGACSCQALFCVIDGAFCHCGLGGLPVTYPDATDVRDSCDADAGRICCVGNAVEDCYCGVNACPTGDTQVARCESGPAMCSRGRTARDSCK